MKDEIDMGALKNTIEVATNRYPYFKKKVTVNSDGAYVLEDNN